MSKNKNPVTAKPQQDTHTHALAEFIKRPQAVIQIGAIFFIILHNLNNQKILITYFITFHSLPNFIIKYYKSACISLL
jgi:hypothetical protein